MNQLIEDVKNGHKRVVKLDKNFHVYIHGDASKFKVVKTKKGSYLKLYFDKAD